MPSLLITGASGFVGLNVLESFLSRGWRVLALSLDGIPDIARRDLARLPGQLEDLRADARDLTLIEHRLAGERFDAVVAAAAITSGPERERMSPGDIIEVNLLAAVRLLEAAARHQVPRMLMFSSSAASGETAFAGRTVLETDPPRPSSIYGATKAAIEAIARRWNALADGPKVWVPRLTAVFGHWERQTGVRDAMSPPFQIVRAALAGEAIAPLPEGGARDWVFAPEVAEAIFWMMTSDQTQGDRCYQLGPGRIWHPSVMIGALEACGVPVRIKPDAPPIHFTDDPRRRRDPHSVDKLAAGFRAPPAVTDAARAYAQWAIEHRDWFASATR
jgi:UDP-glucose 4-epimerase